MPQVTALTGWTASYADPITFRKGQPVTLTGREDIWDGHRWLWTIAPNGKAGWVPDSALRDGMALIDYSAMELTCEAGEALTLLDRSHGWSWCRNAEGQEGWVPDRCLDLP